MPAQACFEGIALDIETAGENSLIVYFAEPPNPALSTCLHRYSQAVKDALGPTLIDLIPAYHSLLVIFDLQLQGHQQVRERISQLSSSTAATSPSGRLIQLPVCYGGAGGPDLERISHHSGLSCEAIIELHQATEYQVYAIGFAPGFAYLGDVDPRIACPRLSTPRLQVPAGSVAIADRQTAVYPSSSPGGWNLIGRCPTPLFNPNQQPPMPISHGDRVRFYAIDEAEYVHLINTQAAPQ